MVEETVATFRPAIEKRALSVDVEAPPEKIIVHADPRHLSRVLRNLTDNAVRYAPAHSTVFIAIAREADAARIDYANTAEDLLPDDLPFLFERFFRGEKSRSRRHGGAGIGLSIVKELVEAHGGSVYGELADGIVHIGFTLNETTETG
jgi:signal transduction histidine kinase